ncbi:MAG: hypothetical protein NT025_09125 [bacterium]|nr:hypothetical protein [bacterium]
MACAEQSEWGSAYENQTVAIMCDTTNEETTMHSHRQVRQPGLIYTGLCALLLFSHSAGAFDFLTLPPSPRATGAGGVLTTAGMEDPLAPIINPGAIGILANHGVIAGCVYAPSTRWFPDWDDDDLRYWSRAAIAGVSAGQASRWTKRKIPVSIGIGYSEVEFRATYDRYGTGGEITRVTDRQYSHGASFGLGYDGPIKIGLGVTTKRVRDTFSENDASGWGADYGLVFFAPFPQVLRADRPRQDGVSCFVTPQISYAATDVGKAVEYVSSPGGPTYLTPLPRTGKVTVGVGAGLASNEAHRPPWQLLSVEVAVQGEDELVLREENGHKYVQPLGDIHVFGDLILGKGNGRIVKRRGCEVNCLDAFYVRRGSEEWAADGYVIESEGWGLRAMGLFRIVQRLVPEAESSRTVKYLARHVDAQLNESRWIVSSPADDTRFRSVSLFFMP